MAMQCGNQRCVKLQQWLAAGKHHIGRRVRLGVTELAGPESGNVFSEGGGSGKLAAIGAVSANKVSIAKGAFSRRPINFTARPQIAAAETTENARSARLGTFPLEGVKGFFDLIHQR
ncbi:hypothetical protein HALO59_70020 [Halomonas sp. 59]|nr:hypothetical protein HALO156_120317 [Halomonas sp. 156]CAD5292691.1 hypothetical protein HALO113_90020 [Halomonas sp. 113]CAD5293903.1 hypothetical protein HALO59_70020 [Halomonas sp. 59]CAD5297354.1 hypothetical protein HALOI3_80020 [Halomonas sp. I3]VXB62575.1 hypothetical protein HALO153_190020 [Halomonas titanicae]